MTLRPHGASGCAVVDPATHHALSRGRSQCRCVTRSFTKTQRILLEGRKRNLESRLQNPAAHGANMTIDAKLVPIATILLTVVAACVPEEERAPKVEPEGREPTEKTEDIEAGAKVAQKATPPGEFDVYLVAFHPHASNPMHQMEAHHYCRQVNEDFAQCVLFDANTENANLNGIEYIISGKMFETLSAEEKRLWHPHNYEILSGQLRAPGLTPDAEDDLMRSKMNSYGKTYHLWNTGGFGATADTMPLGEPQLAWSFNADGEAQAGMIEARDRAMELDTAEARQRRQNMIPLAQPQWGVDALAGFFPARQKPPFIIEANPNAGVPGQPGATGAPGEAGAPTPEGTVEQPGAAGEGTGQPGAAGQGTTAEPGTMVEPESERPSTEPRDVDKKAPADDEEQRR